MRALRILGWTMVWTGALIIAFLAYQLFGTNLITARAQSTAEVALEERVAELADELGEPIPFEDDPTFSAPDEGPIVTVPSLYPEPAPEVGEPVGRITIARIGVDHVLMEGVDRGTLKSGPGHMPWTPLPGQPGNAVISGHRTTYGAPFFDLDQVEPGDLIEVETLRGVHVYAVRESLIVTPIDVWVTESRPGAWLTLTTCNPKFSARQRLVVVAELVEGPNLGYVKAQQAVQSLPAA
ncbi:MAG TPA: sortase [Acidimicrobiia bacterium]